MSFDHWYYLINGLKDDDNASKIINGLKNAGYKTTLFDIIELLDQSIKDKIIMFIKHLFSVENQIHNKEAEK